jgi:hypothetical protein
MSKPTTLRRWTRGLWTVALALFSKTILAAAIIGALAFTATIARGADSLPAWNHGKAKQSIIEFVAKVTKPGSPDFVPVAERIATFDNDGTLWCEKPLPVQLYFALDRAKALAPQHPEWKTKEPFASLLKGDVKGAMAGGEHALLEIIMATHTGMTTVEFDRIVKDWIATAKHPTTGRHYTEMVYQPMLELLAYLRANGFKTFIVSGGGIEFMRAWAEPVYRIPPEQVVGSSIKTKFEIRDGQPVLVRLPELNFNDDKEGKPVGINQHIGRKPVLSGGNVFSGGDIAMLRYCQSHPGATLQLMVNHDDAAREFAYTEPDNASLKAAAANGWMVVNMTIGNPSSLPRRPLSRPLTFCWSLTPRCSNIPPTTTAACSRSTPKVSRWMRRTVRTSR